MLYSCAEYLNNPKATAETLDDDGWLHTGDLVVVDEDGYIFVMDRLKELIKYNAYQVSLLLFSTIVLFFIPLLCLKMERLDVGGTCGARSFATIAPIYSGLRSHPVSSLHCCFFIVHNAGY